MSDIHIPPKALEAGAKALCKEARLFWPDLNDAEHDIMRAEARAACLAMLRAWPERRFRYERNGTYPVVVLPFEEITND